MKKLFALIVGMFFICASALAAININTANQQQLESLNGIGPVKAKAIIDYRTKNGAFKTVDDLKKVSGIGDKTLEKLKKDISVTGTSTVPAPAAATPAKAAAPAAKAAPAKK
ncbi:topoisomerase [Aquitalea magnusonii]|uniref:ComEA family DNA-binding protein n=1 Tax=Aquitalea TaxID=407217 RepID=UPI0005F82579|nr:MULTISPECIES: ComEA family DNA-binding protein [Aquitalea]KJV33070.1 topoisomerase [Aquitalea magnusonii]QBJ77412.1 ComEA family DNA-binding protein [Aquitalea sp. USM4]